MADCKSHYLILNTASKLAFFASEETDFVPFPSPLQSVFTKKIFLNSRFFFFLFKKCKTELCNLLC